MLFCGACRQEIELQEGIARPGHACTSPSHERPKHLHSATMCLAVHQPFEDGEDSFCGPACIVAFNAKIQADYDESLAWLEVDEEPRTRAGATLPKSPWMPSLSCGVSSRATDGIRITMSSSQASSRCWKPVGTLSDMYLRYVSILLTKVFVRTVG